MNIVEAKPSRVPSGPTFHADVPEVVSHDRIGLLGPEGDPKSLTDNLEQLVAQPQIWEPMGTAARRHMAKNYNVGTQVARLEAIYTNLLIPSPRSGA